MDTAGNAREAATWVGRHGFGSLLVVTSAYHAQRTDEIFDFILRDIAPVTVRATNEPVTDAQRIAEASSTEAFHRAFNGLEPGDVSGMLSTLHAHHPLYNGEVYGPDSPGVMPR